MDKDKQLVRPLNTASANTTAPDRAQAGPRGRSESGREKSAAGGAASADVSARRDADGLYDLLPELRPPKLSPEAIAAAMQAMQIDPEEMDAEGGIGVGSDAVSASPACNACGHKNRRGNKFCAMCGAPVSSGALADSKAADATSAPAESRLSRSFTPDVMASSSAIEPIDGGSGAHHYHHHYHHHFFPGGQDVVSSRPASSVSRDPGKLGLSPVLKPDTMNRAEAAVRRVTQDWVLACNTKHLDDLLELYAADALVLRSNHPSVRGAAAIREFFFNALDSGLGEVEVEPLRVEVVGGFAYEAGRCKALVPGGSSGNRREERGKYLWVLAKQEGGEWKLAADCWSSDLTLPVAAPEIALATGAKPNPSRKNL